MMRLYIGGMLAQLPSNFSTEFYSRSPYFTDEGDFTLNIDLDLHHPLNARIFSYIHRIDRTKRTTRRDAVLMEGSMVIVKGKEILLEVDEEKASIQIVGGASELNDAMGDKMLQDLDLWHRFDRSTEVAFFPVCDFNEAPHAEWGLMDGDQYEAEETGAKMKWHMINRPSWNGSTQQLVMSYDIGQPYFWAIMEHVIAALGFTVGTNVLKTDTRYNKMVMVHAIRSEYVADILPRWSVVEFFEEIQKFFNVVIDVDIPTHTVHIIHAYDFFSSSVETIDHADIIETVNKDFDNDSDMTMVSYGNVSYDFTDKKVNKYAAISPKLVDRCTLVLAQNVTDKASYEGIWKAILGSTGSWPTSSHPIDNIATYASQYKIILLTMGGETRQFVLWTTEDDFCSLKMVDMFGEKQSPLPGANEVKMKIVPCRMVSSPIQGANGQWWRYPLPTVDGEYSSFHNYTIVGEVPSSTDPAGLNAEIISGKEDSEDSKRADVIFAAYYFGVVSVDWEESDNSVPNWVTVPIGAPDWQLQVMKMRGAPGSSYFWKTARHIVLSQHLTMAINGDYGMDEYTYSKNATVDTAAAYTVRFRNHRRRDVRATWLIDNRKFYCKELKYSFSDGKMSEVVEGVFLPVLSSTATNESGEVEHYVTYDLSRVVVAHKVQVVEHGGALSVLLEKSTPGTGFGGSGTSQINAKVWMSGVEITSTAFSRVTANGNAQVEIASVTGDVHIQAWVE